MTTFIGVHPIDGEGGEGSVPTRLSRWDGQPSCPETDTLMGYTWCGTFLSFVNVFGHHKS
jgi:hypothetical protein